jgi:chitodextrinase
VLAHELGHNLGLAHAGGLYCTNGGTVSSGSAVTISGVCGDPSPDQYVYGDPFDAMGRSAPVRQMSMEHKLELGLLPSSAVKIVGGPGAYRIAPMETLTGSPELLRIPKPGGGNYYVEYRQPIGFFDSQAPAMNGVYIRTEAPANPNDGNRADTLLVDMHPATQGDWADAAMDINQVFNDPLTGIAIQDVEQDPTGATLQINAPRDAVPPSAVGALTASSAGTGASLQWTAATDNYAVDHYVIARNGTQVSTTTGLTFADTGLVPGSTVAYTVAAVDVGGNVGPAASASVTVPDTTAPSAPGKVTAKLTKDGKVHVAWTAATDNGSVAAYRVLRAGKLIASGNDFAYVDKTAKPGSGSTLIYSVAAVDLAGNVGPVGKATPLRSALLRKLMGSSLTAMPVTVARRAMLRVKGKVSDPKARCRLRIGTGSWHACKAQSSGAFSVTMPAQGTTPVTLSLRDSLGRVKTQTVRVGVQLVRVG